MVAGECKVALSSKADWVDYLQRRGSPAGVKCERPEQLPGSAGNV